jgi:glutamate-5-semialdehyde dehydrogenase
MSDAVDELKRKGKAARVAAHRLAYVSTETKNRALAGISADLVTMKDRILAANQEDMVAARAAGMSEALLDRLLINQARLEGISKDVLTVAALPDPVGEFFDMRTMPNGLVIGKKRVPLGVIGTIYESRPNVTVDISALCLKSGNAVILRGGKEALNTNLAFVRVIQDAATRAGMPEGCVQFVENTDRALVEPMLKMNEYIDLLVPRGSAQLIKFVSETATVPVVAGGVGVCHTYVDRTADPKKAASIIFNAKVQRPTVCNALDSVLIHSGVAHTILPAIAAELAEAGVEMHCDDRAMAVLRAVPGLNLKPAVPEDWGKEFLALIAAIKVVDSLEDALSHIEQYGSGHSEAIVTEDYESGMRFLNQVDAACVYVNASTRFTDGGQFGLGAEVGISTQKMHARGPLGLRELTSYKWIVFGNGQVRP